MGQILSVIKVKSIKKPGLHLVGGVPGLGLLVSETGGRSWILRITIRGKRRDVGLGSYEFISLEDARDEARKLRRAVKVDGLDPVELKREKRLAESASKATLITFDECASQYIAGKRAEWSNEKHAAQWAATLATYASPFVGALPVASIDLDGIKKVLEPIWVTKTETASRVRQRVEAVLDWATVHKYRTGDNPARWRGHLDKILAKPSKVADEKHHPALPFGQVREFMQELRAAAGTAARAVELAVLTASRSGSVRKAEWAEFDLQAKVWTVPGPHMKAKVEHRIPLSDAAVVLIKSMIPAGITPDQKPTGIVFKAPRGGALSDMTLTAVLRRMNAQRAAKKLERWRDADARDIVVHGFRSTFRDWAGETSKFPREVVEHAMAHRIKDKAEAAYARGTLFDKRRELMDTWAARSAQQSAQA